MAAEHLAVRAAALVLEDEQLLHPVLAHLVERQRLGALTDYEAHLEGFSSAREFEVVWARINGGYDTTTWVWRVEFVPVIER